MKAAIALYYIACYSVNLLNLCLLAFLWLRGRHEAQRQELLFMFGLMLISLSLTLPGLLVTDPADYTAALNFVFLATVSAGICLVAGATPGYLHSFRPDRLGRRVTRIAWLAAGGLFCAVLTELCLTGTNRLILPCFVAMLAAIAWSAGWFFWQVFRHRSSFLANPAARVTLTMCLVTLATMPLMALNDFFNALPFLRIADGKQRIVLVPLFLAVWSVALIRKNLRELARTAPTPAAVPSAGLDSAAPEPADLAACFGLSERELEVLPWLAAGLSYEEIGDKLCISHSTVKTHVRNIYKKMAISGKIALISRLRELNHPVG